MCGIIAAFCKRPVAELLIAGLERLEYRGYDSAGIAVETADDTVLCREVGKVAQLKAAFRHVDKNKWQGQLGIGHTRWATHGKVNLANTHPHQAGDLVLVHNGIIENHSALRDELRSQGAEFSSTTDSEVIAHLIFQELKTNSDFKSAVQQAAKRMRGAFAIAVMCARFPGQLIALREGSPLVFGVGADEFFVASDVLALAGLTDNVIFLESGDLVQIKDREFKIFSAENEIVERPVKVIAMQELAVEKGGYNHFMQKEIFEQPLALKNTYNFATKPIDEYFGAGAEQMFKQAQSVQIVACGTSYHAGAVARYLLESSGILTQVEVASEYLYREVVVPKSCLLVFISQSGETADTLAALQKSKQLNYLATLSICNVANSSLNVQTNFACLTHAGREIGVAATKTFTAQLIALQALYCALSGRKMFALPELEVATEFVLKLDDAMRIWAQDFIERNHALYLARGSLYPIAQEGALKLKEISYLHAEAYPAGELKHGPLALIDEEIPIVALAPDDELLDKMLSNLAEVATRGGRLYILTSLDLEIPSEQVKVFHLPDLPDMLRAIVYTVPLQLLAYHVAVLKGADVDQPRNLAKSVTVE